MSEEQLKAFIAKAKDDQSIQEKLKAAKTSEEVVGIAKEAGFMISADELKKSQSEVSENQRRKRLPYRYPSVMSSHVKVHEVLSSLNR